MLLVPCRCIPNYLLLLFLYSWSSGCRTTCTLALYNELSTAVVSLQLIFRLSRYLFLVVVYQIIYCLLFLYLKLVFGLSRYLFRIVVFQIIYCCCFFAVGLGAVTLEYNRLLLFPLCSLVTLRVSRTHDLSLDNSKTTQANKFTQVHLCYIRSYKTGAGFIFLAPRQVKSNEVDVLIAISLNFC